MYIFKYFLHTTNRILSSFILKSYFIKNKINSRGIINLLNKKYLIQTHEFTIKYGQYYLSSILFSFNAYEFRIAQFVFIVINDYLRINVQSTTLSNNLTNGRRVLEK